MPFNLGITELLVVLVLFFGVGVAGTVFWIWVLIDCATKESSTGNDKVVWIVIVLFTHLLGALLYFFIRRPQRIRDLGA